MGRHHHRQRLALVLLGAAALLLVAGPRPARALVGGRGFSLSELSELPEAVSERDGTGVMCVG